jgi:type I restriction enzyme S subunit
MMNVYLNQKDVDAEWIASIPSSWSIKPLFSVASCDAKKNLGMLEENLLSLSFGRIIRKDIDALGGLLPESFETYQIVEAGDIILRPTDLQNDKRSLRTAICKEKGIITSAYIAIKSGTELVPEFLNYLLRSYDFKKVFYGLGSGMRQSLKFNDIKWLPLVMPPAPCVIVLVASNFLIRGKKWQQDIAKNLNSRLFKNY